MKTVKVKQVAIYRDGGTKEYKDSEGNSYFTSPFGWGKGLIYGNFPRDRYDNKVLDVILDIEG